MHDATLPAIVVFTRGRPRLVRTLACFHSCYDGQLVIVDGSEDPAQDLQLPRRGVYLHRPGMSMSMRIAEGIARVESPACALSADDDFMLHGGLEECGRVLHADGGVACATGTVAYFWTGVPSAGEAIADHAVERALDLSGRGGPADRFLESAVAAPSLFYACVRTSVAERISRMLADVPDQHGLVAEQLWTLLPSVFGRTQMVDRLMLCRRKSRRDYSAYVAPFRSMEDIAEWQGFPAMRSKLLGLAGEAGAACDEGERIVETWRRFAAATRRGRRSQKSSDPTFGAFLRRRLRGLSVGLRVASDPWSWGDRARRSMARNAAARLMLRCNAYHGAIRAPSPTSSG